MAVLEHTLVSVAAVLLLAAAPPAWGQESSSGKMDLGQLYRQARVEAQAARHFHRRTRVRPAAPVPLRTPRADSLRAWLRRRTGGAREAPVEPRQTLAFPIERRHAFGRLEQPVFESRFHDVHWSFLGANGRTVLDTMRTRELRARLQARFGDPTRTAVDADALEGRPAADYVQFEYWLTANDSIPVKVVDTGGPFDRGLVFIAPRRYRSRLRALREAVLGPLPGLPRARYVDYYFDPETERWYRAGFDGRDFFVEAVNRRAVMPGRRPVLRARPEPRE